MDQRQATTELDWEVTGSSVRGASHLRTGAVNQDALRWTRMTSVAETVILALADGHGSKRSYRSAQGAEFAVGAAISAAHHFLTPERLTQSPADLAQDVREVFAPDFLDLWRTRVRMDLDKHPPTPSAGHTGRLAMNPYLVYGSTCLCSVITPHYAIHWQIGDGDILHVQDDATVARPLPSDERHIANETTSLCSEDALESVRVAVIDFETTPPPSMILASTDGYANSFRDEKGFLQVASDVWALIEDEGFEAVAADLEDWLAEASARGSGDDITVGLMARRSALKQKGGAS